MASFTPSNSIVAGRPSQEQEKAELAALLESETFKRSPKLSRLLAYLCDKYFRDEAGEIGEYSIAVDVLGRDSGFDPQIDAIVRVDTHHLRRRLKQYYDTAGSDHEFRIVIPAGQYTPRFEPRPEPTMPESAPPEAVAGTGEKPKSWRRKWLWLAAGLCVIAAGATLFETIGPSSRVRRQATEKAASLQTASLAAAPLTGEADGIRILAGDRSGNYVDKAGQTWLSDRYFTGGVTFHRESREIQRTQEPEIFRTGREGQFAYEIPLDPGIYELHLYFAETGVVSEGLRSVSLAINGIPHSTLDVASDAAGVNTATVKIFKDISPAKDGLLHLTFQGGDPSFVNALEILPGTRGKMRPIRLTARDSSYRDHLGRVWMPDQGFLGGRRTNRNGLTEGTADQDLYHTQRFGHFSYSIPVAEGGHYTITLYFSETYFGPPNSVGGVGSRVFDVYSNGTTLLKNFDILKEAGGNRPVIKVFHNIAASPQGKIDLSFVPIANYAVVTAIEVIEE